MTFKRMLRFMIENNIKDNEYFLLMSLYYNRIDDEVPALIKKYANKWGYDINGKKVMYSVEEKENLVAKGYLQKTDNKYQLTNKFLDLFIDSYTAGTEFIDNYPSFIVVNHVKVPLKTVSRTILREKYWEAIQHDRHEHEEVMKDLHYGKQHKMVNLNIEKFIEVEFWKDIREERIVHVNKDWTQKDDL